MRIVLALMLAGVVAGAVVLGILLTQPAPLVHTPELRRTIPGPVQVPPTAAPCKILNSAHVLERCLS